MAQENTSYIAQLPIGDLLLTLHPEKAEQRQTKARDAQALMIVAKKNGINITRDKERSIAQDPASYKDSIAPSIENFSEQLEEAYAVIDAREGIDPTLKVPPFGALIKLQVPEDQRHEIDIALALQLAARIHVITQPEYNGDPQFARAVTTDNDIPVVQSLSNLFNTLRDMESPADRLAHLNQNIASGSLEQRAISIIQTNGVMAAYHLLTVELTPPEFGIIQGMTGSSR
ncbi:MAG: hypothetical protein ACK48P_00985 [Holosporales bacterium]